MVNLSDVSALAAAMARRRTGITERPSARKSEASRRSIAVARLVASGDHAEADRLRWLYWPERMRAEELERQRGGPGNDPHSAGE